MRRRNALRDVVACSNGDIVAHGVYTPGEVEGTDFATFVGQRWAVLFSQTAENQWVSHFNEYARPSEEKLPAGLTTDATHWGKLHFENRARVAHPEFAVSFDAARGLLAFKNDHIPTNTWARVPPPALVCDKPLRVAGTYEDPLHKVEVLCYPGTTISISWTP